MPVSTLITAEEYGRMSFDRSVELIRGEVAESTSPGGLHGKVCFNFNFNRVFSRWSGCDAGYSVFANDTGVLTESDPDTVRGPDLAVIHDSAFGGGQVPRGIIRQPPELCVEVRSPSDRWSEVLGKVGEFLDAGVKEVWVIDPDAWRVHVYVSGGDVEIRRAGDFLKAASLPDLEFPVEELFRGIPAPSDDHGPVIGS